MAILAAWISSATATRIRAKSYNQAKLGKAPAFLTNLNLPVGLPTAGERRRVEPLRKLFDVEHKAAASLQDRTVAKVYGASGALITAFIVAIASTTVLSSVHEVHIFSSVLDLASLLLVVVYFLAAMRLRIAWIRERAISEFLRQWLIVQPTFLARGANLEDQFQAFRSRVVHALDVPRGQLGEAIRSFGIERLAEMRKALSALRSIESRRFYFYVAQRAAGQERWFHNSVSRISSADSIRRRALKAMFGLALAAAAAKVILVMSVPQADARLATWITFALLLFVGGSGALASVHLSLNARSLGHRYRMQLNAIEAWFVSYGAAIRSQPSTTSLTSEVRVSAVEAVLAFEGLMMAELADWASISEEDSLELSPA